MITLTDNITNYTVSARPELTANLDPDKNPDDSQGPGYHRGQKRRERPPSRDDNDNRLAPMKPGNPGGGAYARRPPPYYGAENINRAGGTVSPDPAYPAPLLRRRAEAYESNMLIF